MLFWLSEGQSPLQGCHGRAGWLYGLTQNLAKVNIQLVWR